MQQFNILPINVSQKVEIKDESTDLMSTSSKGEFSQHIDLHLAKSKDATNDDKGVLVNKSDVNTAETPSENTNAKVDDKTLQSSNTSVTTSDETDSASSPLEVAASGKKNDKTLNTEQTVTLAEPEPLVDESQLLMSFLLKADQTLVTNNFAQDIKNSEMSAEQIAKYETQLLLKSSGLVADLSGITQALNASSEVVLGELQHTAQSLLVAANTITDSDTEQVTIKALIDEESLVVEGSTKARFAKLNSHLEGDKANSDLTLNEKRSLNKDLALKSLDGESANSVTVDEQVIAATQKASDAQAIKNGLVANSVQAIDKDITKVEQKLIQREFIQQQILSGDALTENNNIEASEVELMPHSPLNEQAMANRQNPAEVASNNNEKVAHLAQSNNGIAHIKEEGLAATIAANQNTNSDISSSARNFSQGGFSQGNAAITTTGNLSPTSTETASQQGELIEDETQLGTKSVDHLIEQNKGVNSGKNNEITNNKVVSNTNADFSINSDLSEITGRASQASQNIADQQATDLFNPRASSDVSQSQKTNTQLHQETIAMFRKDFSDAVKDKVMLMISQKLQQFDITLDPPELGNIHVKVNLQGEQATVNFVVQNQQAKDAFEQNMHKLKELLAEQGVDVGDANVEQQSQQSDNNEMNQENAAENNQQIMTNTADASDAIEHSLSASIFNSSTSAVDYYA